MSYNNSSFQTAAQKDGVVDLAKYLKYWYLFVACIGLSLAIAYLYLKTTTYTFQVSSTLFIQEDKKGESALSGTAFNDLNMFNRTVTVDNEIATLRSRALLMKVMEDLNMGVTYFVEDPFKRIEIYGNDLPIQVKLVKANKYVYYQDITFTILDNKSFSIEEKETRHVYQFNRKIRTPNYTIEVTKGPAFHPDYPPVIVRFINLYKLAESYSGSKLDITPITKESNTIVLSIIDAVPRRSIDFLNKLIETYNYENVENKNKLALKTIEFINNRLKYLGADLTSTGQEVEQYKQANRVANVAADAQQSLQKSVEYNQQLSNIEIQKNVVSSLESYIEKPGSQFEMVPSTLGLPDATLAGLINKYNDLQIERQRLLRTAQPNNPIIVHVDEQLSGLKENIGESLRNIKKGLAITSSNLKSNSSQYESRILAAPAIERGLSERSREQGVKEGLYNYLLQKREEAALSVSATMPTSRVVDAPSSTSNPVSPKTSFIYLCAFFVGCILPASGLFIRDYLNTKVQGINDIEQINGVLILGELSHKQDKDTLVINKNSRTTISELFRYIRTNLNYMTDNITNKVMLVTSSMKGEGKTFFSINLGATLALVNKKVLLIEFDLRKPDLLKSLHLKNTIGLTNYFNSEASLDEIIQSSNYQPNLYVIGCGPLPEDPAELLMGPRVAELFEQLRERFDFIIIDTSPVGQVADAFSLAPYTDASIYLVRHNYTDKTQLNILKDIFENNKLKKPMVVLNDAKSESFKGYGYGGYGYNYTDKKAYS